MTFDEFVKKYTGKAIDFDGSAGVQCVDLVDQYLKDVFGITGVWVVGARDFYNKFSTYPALTRTFVLVPNTRPFVAKKGDIIIWGGGTYGHCAVADGFGDINKFYSYEQNTYGKHEPTNRVLHYYNNKTGADSCHPVLGALRAKPEYQHCITGVTKEYNVTAPDGTIVGVLKMNI